MATPNNPKSSWPKNALAEVFLLGMSVLSGAHAAAPSDPAIVKVAVLDTDVDAGDGDLAGAQGIELYLELTLNGRPYGLRRFGSRDNALWAGAGMLRQLGFALPADASGPVRLRSLPGLGMRYDALNQRVGLDAPAGLLKLPTTIVDPPATATTKASASPGVLLNYDLYGSQGTGGAASLNAFTELRAFNGTSVLSSTALSQMTRSGTGAGWQEHTVRLDTTWSESFPDDMLTLRIGDTVTAALPWSRSTLIGGIQLSSNFALQPYRVTTPVPALMGSAALPSDVEVYVNGMNQYKGQVPSGPFQLNTVPSISGAGNAQVVMTDAFGRTTTLNFSLYDSHQLLQKGLSDWSVELGAVRKNYGLASFDYGSEPAGSGTWRHGVTDTLTVNAHAEATRDLFLAGGGAAWLLGHAGTVSGAVAHSRNNDLSGSLFNLGYSWVGNRLNFSVDGTHAQDGYRDVASLYGAVPATGTGRALVGYSFDELGSFGASYLHLRYLGQAANRYANFYWFKSLGRRAAVNVSFNQNLNDRHDRNLSILFTWNLDGHTTYDAGVQNDKGKNIYSADAQSSTPSDGGFGWRAGLRQGAGQNGAQGEIDYLGRYGQLAAGITDFGGNRNLYADATGSIVFMGGDIFAARHIDDAFAVVSTDGVPGVPVTLENRAIGNTDSKGMLLVSPLNAYQNNQVAIDPMQLPADVRIDRVKAIATPSDRAGTMLRFGITPVRAASIVLVDAADRPLPLGSLVHLHGQPGQPVLVGYDGATYIDTLDLHNELEVDTPASSCHVGFDYPQGSKGVPQIGPLRCVRN